METMSSLLELQSRWRMEGNHQQIGKMLVDGDHCTYDDLRDAIGLTAEAEDVLARICITEERKHGLHNLLQKWTPGHESLFKMALDVGLVTFEEIVDASAL